MTRAAVDIGSNSLLLLVLNDQGEVMRDLSRVIGLGRGLGDAGEFAPDRIRAAVQTLAQFALEAQSFGIAPGDVRVAATSAARRAHNAQDFIDQVHSETGLRVQVISGEQEARLTWLGARLGLDLPEASVGVVDLGGGSTEIVVGTGADIETKRSLEIGTVRLTEKVCGAPPEVFTLEHREEMLARATLAIAPIEWSSRPELLIGVAGTATTLAASELNLERWNAEVVHGFDLTRDALERWTHRLVGPDRAARRALTRVSPERADTVLAGACILLRVCEDAGIDGLKISVGGIRHGLLCEKAL
jgi:exopolyphosphatase/guanosine-5'-triphosphate,3'-diphosphate pyrophosphatase